MHAPNGSPHNKYMHIHRERINYQITLKVLYKTGSATCVCKDKAGLYTEISPRGGANLGCGQKRGGLPGGSSVVSCEVLHSRGGENDTRGGECPPPAPP